ncbi:MAG TPA: PQQ-binding-like beta-propeller repeat protein [Thermoguttaceae bacterium]
MIEELPTDDAMQKLLDRRDPWPTGDVEVVSNQSKNNLMSNYNRSPLKLKGSPGPYFANVNLTYDPSRHMLLCFDALGNNLWQLVMSEVQLQRQQFIPYNPAFSHIRALGHLLLFSVSGRLYAIDTLGGGGNGHPRIIWSQNINEMSGDLSGLHPFIFRAPLPGIMSLRMMQMYGQNNDLEPATTGLICVQHSRSLIALDPLNGSKLWIRDDIPQGSVTFGDEEYVFVLPPDKSEALVLRALDGELLGTRKIPRNKVHIDRSDGQVVNYAPLNEICPATIGRNMMLWRTENNKRVLEVYDPWTQKSAWEPRKFAIDAQYCLVGSEAIGVMQPSGQFVLLNLPDGRTLAEVKLKAEPNLVDLTVMESDDQYLVLTHASQQAPGAPPQRPMNPLSGAASKLVISGRLYALDRNGKLRWPAPVQINNQQLLVNQPPGLPVLVFVCQSYEQRQNTPDRPQLYILAVDKRSGRTVYDNKISNSTGIFNVVGNMEKKTVDFIMQRRTITLTFTDKPLPPPDNKSEIKKTDQSPLEKIRGFFKLAEKTMKQMFGLFDEDDWDKDTSQDQ